MDGLPLLTELMGLFEKRRFKNFLLYIQEYEQEDPKTHKGFNARHQTMQELYNQYKLDSNVADVTGHALALYLNDE